MLPVVAIVGRPNVGKSTLFNVLVRSRDALVADRPGVTRDRKYGVCRTGGRPFVVVDTGGLDADSSGLGALAARQTERAIDEADLVVLLVDARAGLVPGDHAILDALRRKGRGVLLAINKTDGLDAAGALAEFSPLGLPDPCLLSAAHGRGVDGLLAAIGARLPERHEDAVPVEGGVRVAIIGRPNVGKSTLVNRLLGDERVIASEIPGTTRDAIDIALERDGRRYTLIDTAGVRRRSRVDDPVETFSVIKTLQALDSASVAVVLLDATEGVTDQDNAVLGHVLDSGRALVIAVNKWDGLDRYARERCLASLDRKLAFVPWARRITISALHGSGLGELVKAIDRAHAAAGRVPKSSDLTRALEAALAGMQPPRYRGHAPRLRYAHPGGNRPPTIVIHGTRTRHIGASYRRYLENFFRARYRLEGTPVRIEFAEGDNPYADRPRERMIRRGSRRKPSARSRRARR